MLGEGLGCNPGEDLVVSDPEGGLDTGVCDDSLPLGAPLTLLAGVLDAFGVDLADSGDS